MRHGLVLVVVALAGCVAAAAGAAPAAAPITLAASSTVAGRERPVVTLFGSIGARKSGEYVAIQGKECGIPGAFFRAVGGTQTTEDGKWSVEQSVRTKTTFRAVWRDAKSATLTVRVRMWVSIIDRGGNRFWVRVASSAGNMAGKRVVVQRFDNRIGVWRDVKTVVLEESEYLGSAEKDNVRIVVPKGTTLRAKVSAAQAGPCYLGSVSSLVRT